MSVNVFENPNEVIRFSDVLSFAHYKTHFFCSWFGPASLEGIEGIFDGLKHALKNQDTISVVMILEEGAEPPDAKARARTTEQQNELADEIESFSILIPQEGYIFSIQAILAKALQRTRKRPWKQCIKRTEEAMVQWNVENDPNTLPYDELLAALKAYRSISQAQHQA